MSRVKDRLLRGYCPTPALKYATVSSGKVNWITGAYGWQDSLRQIYQKQQLCGTILQDVNISLPHLYLLPRWFGYFTEVTRNVPRRIPPFPGSIIPDTRRLGSSISSTHHSDGLEVSPHQLHTWWASVLCVAYAWEMGQSPFRLDIWLCPFRAFID